MNADAQTAGQRLCAADPSSPGKSPSVARRQSEWPSTQGSLLQRLRRHDDAAAWAAFVDLYTPLVYRSCRRRGLQDADACDVTQNVFLRVSRTLPRFEYSRENGYFRGWLGTVIRNEICRYGTKRAAGQTGTERLREQHSIEDDVWVDEFNDHILRTALDRIRPEFAPDVWEAFKLLWIENRSTVDVIDAFGRDRNWLYKAKHRVIHRLEQEVLLLCDDIPQFHQ